MLGYTRHSSGDIVRRVLAHKGLTLEAYNTKAQTDSSLDAKVDEVLRELREHNDIVIDSRLGFYWLPESFKVYLDLDLSIATARIYKDTISNTLRRDTEEGGSNSLSDVAKQVASRMQNEQIRFRNLYGVDPYNTEHFDLIIDTSRHSPQTVALTVFDAYKKWLATDSWRQERSSIPLGYSFKNQY